MVDIVVIICIIIIIILSTPVVVRPAIIKRMMMNTIVIIIVDLMRTSLQLIFKIILIKATCTQALGEGVQGAGNAQNYTFMQIQIQI